MDNPGGHDLSGIHYTAGKNHQHDKVGIVVSKWNPEITNVLALGAEEVLLTAGVPAGQITRLRVPGSYELASGAQMLLEKDPDLHAIICLGCVIQGETRHFDFICQAAADGIMQTGLKYNKPVIFGVLTPGTHQQALDRAGGKYGNKGMEAAVALLEMLDLSRS